MEGDETISAVSFQRELFRRTFSSPATSASDAVESLLLLGEKPVLSSENVSTGIAPIKRSSTGTDQRPESSSMMHNYYQKMRMRNNEASKRCRLKRRIKQESLDKTKILLERQKQILSQRLVRLNKIKDLLAEACREFNNKTDGTCNCVSYCKSIWATRDEMSDKNNITNSQLVRDSKILRSTNLEEIIGADLYSDILKPMRRGPRKQELDNLILIDSQTGQIKSQSPLRLGAAPDLKYKSEGESSTGLEGPAKILEMVHSSSGSSFSGSESSEKPLMDFISSDSKISSSGDSQEALDLSRSQSQVLSRNIEDNNQPLYEETSKSCPLIGVDTDGGAASPSQVTGVNRHQLPFLAALTSPTQVQSRLLKKQASDVQPLRVESGENSNLPNTTIILTPLSSSIPPTVLNLPMPRSTVQNPDLLPASPPSLSIVEKMEPEEVDIKPDPSNIKMEGMLVDQDLDDDDFPEQRNLCISMDEADGPAISAEVLDKPLCAAHANSSCSGELVDLNSLSQTLNLFSMQPKPPGQLTAAEKYIIKSRLGLVYWRAEEKPAWICAKHRYDIIHGMDTMSCSLCGKRRSKKGSGPMYMINYRIGVEYHVTQGKFLKIGLLACHACRIKTLKGIDFSDSVCMDGPAEREEEEKKISLPSSLSANFINKSNLAAIQPQPQQKQSSVQEQPRIHNTEGTIFSKIGKLNKSLQAVNPRYKPLGFSITSLESLSPGVLQDTLEATKIALQTILSTIAPGQEQQLWEAVKPFMEGAAHETKP